LHLFLYEKYISGITESMQSHSTGIRNLDGDAYKGIEVNFPPLPEQKRIVFVLDKAFAAIATAKENAEKNLMNARALFDRNLAASLLDPKWKWTSLGEVCLKVEYGSSAKSKRVGKIPVLRMGNIQDGRFTWDDLVYSDNQAEIDKYRLKSDDVLFNRTNSAELVGKSAIYKGEAPAIFAGYLIRIHRRDEVLDGDYLNYYLNSKHARDYGKTVAISSVNQANINGKKLMSYPIPVPPMADQKVIVKKLSVLSEKSKQLETIYREKMSQLEFLKKSILQKAFAGELSGAQV